MKNLIVSAIMCVSAGILVRYLQQQHRQRQGDGPAHAGGSAPAAEADAEEPRLRRYAVREILSGSREFCAPISTLVVDEPTGFVFVSGLVADDLLDADLSGVKGDTGREAAAVLAAIARLLRAVGASMEHATAALVHLADMDDMEALNGAFAEYYTAGSGPSRTTVQSSSIVLGNRVEITMTARRPPGAPALPPSGLLAVPAEVPRAAAGGPTHLRKFGAADVDFHSPIATVTVDTASGMIHLSGIVSDDIVPPPPGKGDAARETENILLMAKGLLAAVGASFDDVVYALVHFADLEGDFAAVNRVWSSHFTQPVGPARTAVHASRIVLDSKVEVTLTALLPPGSRGALPATATLDARAGAGGARAGSGAASATIRRFSPAKISFRAPISSVVVDEATGLIHIAGLVILNIAGAPADGRGDAEVEARAVLAAVSDIVATLGSSMRLLTTAVVHVLSLDDFEGVNRAFADFFEPGAGPARTTIEVAEVVRGCRVELSFTALRARGAPPLPDAYVI